MVLGTARKRLWALAATPLSRRFLAAWLLRVPRMIHEQNGVLGRVNQFLPRPGDNKLAFGIMADPKGPRGWDR